MNRVGIFLRVLGIHLLLVAALLTPVALDSCVWFQEEEVVMTVDLDALPPAPAREDPQPPEEDPEPDEDAVIPATPIPTARPTPPPTPSPEPAPTATPEPAPTATPRPAPTATPEPAPPPTPTPASRLLTAEEIRRRIEQEDPQRADPPPPDVDADRLREQLARDFELGNGGGGSGSEGSRGGNGVDVGTVKAELDARLDAAWTQPPGVPVGSGLLVSVRVERDGRISRTRIMKASGHPELDASVRKALSIVRRVRPFPEGYTGGGETFEYRFQIK